MRHRSWYDRGERGRVAPGDCSPGFPHIRAGLLGHTARQVMSSLRFGGWRWVTIGPLEQHQPCFVRVDCQTLLGKALGENRQDPASIFLVGESHDEVVRVADRKRSSFQPGATSPAPTVIVNPAPVRSSTWVSVAIGVMHRTRTIARARTSYASTARKSVCTTLGVASGFLFVVSQNNPIN